MFTAADVWTRPYHDRPDWYDQAACRNHPHPNWWFKETAHKSRNRERSRDPDTLRAIAICQSCPVRDDCLEHALQQNEHWGIWGALDYHERRAIVRRRRLGAVG